MADFESWADSDEPIPEDDAISAAHPTRNGSHDTYAEAMRMVGAKRSKHALVMLVNWLLVERERLSSICTRANPYLHRIGAVSGSVADRAQTASEIHEQTQKQLTASRERERRLRELCGEAAMKLHGDPAGADDWLFDELRKTALAAADGETGGGT